VIPPARPLRNARRALFPARVRADERPEKRALTVDFSLAWSEEDHGRPFVVDAFNAQQRMLGGALPKDAIAARVAAGTLTIVEVDQRTHCSR
jgi:hypothetical protein